MLTVPLLASFQSFDKFFHKVKWPKKDIKNFDCSQKVAQSTYGKAKPIFGKPKPSPISCQKLLGMHQLQTVKLWGWNIDVYTWKPLVYQSFRSQVYVDFSKFTVKYLFWFEKWVHFTWYQWTLWNRKTLDLVTSTSCYNNRMFFIFCLKVSRVQFFIRNFASFLFSYKNRGRRQQHHQYHLQSSFTMQKCTHYSTTSFKWHFPSSSCKILSTFFERKGIMYVLRVVWWHKIVISVRKFFLEKSVGLFLFDEKFCFT